MIVDSKASGLVDFCLAQIGYVKVIHYSPLQFILVMETLSFVVNKAIALAFWRLFL